MSNKSNRDIQYRCTRCGREVGRGNLITKRAVFREMGVQGRTVKSRVTDWLCIIPQDDGSPSCRDTDTAWIAEERLSTPGMADTRPKDEPVDA